ncbi:MAG TPA: hypothetical protein VGD10_11170 [Allosphingosinicella sp.]|uniref:hypothetical protein n=1 Tax=Allosphingosinicella sp. TaxID=2823234 RepID=UPI002EDA16D1
MRRLKTIIFGGLLLGSLVLALLLFPQPLFGYSMSHDQFRVWSDRPIDPAMTRVLNDAVRRLRTSKLYDPDEEFRLFICNDAWRLWIFARSTAVGGSADTVLSRNIYLREADVASNRLIPPGGVLSDAEVRPLSYFVAHEATHIIESRTFGRLMKYRYPDWLTEGYADLIGKGGDFDFEENRRLLQADDNRLDPRRSGLYRRYHLMVAYLIEGRGHSVEELFANPPSDAVVLGRLLTSS